MTISNIPLFSMLRTRMHWHQERQRVLSENVANADTPNFHPRDLAPLTFETAAPKTTAALGMLRTDARHLVGNETGSRNGLQDDRKVRFGVRPAGKAVGLGEQTMPVASNQMDYQAATPLYTRSLGLIKTALGKR